MISLTNAPGTCPECGATIDADDGPVHAYLPAPPGCWAKFNQALAREFSDSAYWKSHRLTVDAYCAQHATGSDRRQIQSVAIHLVALYLNLEKRYTNKQIANAMDKLITVRKGQFPLLTKPEFVNTMNINHLLAASNPDEHHSIAMQWAREVWNAWQHEHATIANLAS